MTQDKVVNNPRDAYSRAFLALFAAHLGDRRRAEFEINQALGMGTENVKVLRAASRVYEALGDRNRTLITLRNAPGYLLNELNRQPDLKDLQRDPRFANLVASKPAQP